MKATNLLTLCAAALTFAAVSTEAAGKASVVEQLKPVEMIVGSWDAQMKGGDGQPVTIRIDAQPDLGGAAINLAWEMIEPDGKQFFMVRALYFWEPETKRIAYRSFDTLGGVGYALLAKQTDRELVWQASFCRGDGRPATAVYRVEMADQNTFNFEYMNEVVAGEVRPKGPSFAFKRVATRPAKSAAPVVLSEKMKSLQGVLVSTTEASFKDEQSNPIVAKLNGQADTGGTTIATRWGSFTTAGEPIQTGLITYYWQPDTQSLAYFFITSAGDRGAAVLAKDTDSERVWQESGYNAQGKPFSKMLRITPSPDADYAVQFTENCTAGEHVPDSPKIPFKAAATNK